MLPGEILKKVRLIEVGTRRRVDDLMSGQFRSHFKGSGMQFSEHRLYVPGDDVRHIDWKVSARVKDPLIKKFEEERELTVLLLVDASGSSHFGSIGPTKLDAIAESCAMIAFAATNAGDKVGLVLFDGEVRKLLPPRKGKQQFLRILREIIAYEPSESQARGTALGPALDSARRILKHSGVIFIASDFQASGYEIPLRMLSRKHELVSLEVTDARDRILPDVGAFLAVDPETGLERWIDTSSLEFRDWFESEQVKLEEEKSRILTLGRVDRVSLKTEADYLDALVKYFRARKRVRTMAGGLKR